MNPSALAESVDYRRRLNDAYVSTHFSMVRSPGITAIRRDFPYFRKHLLPHLPADRGAAILDLGCGYGPLLYTLAEHGYRNATGVDSSPEQVELAGSLGIGGVVRAEALEHLRQSPNSYDVIFAVDLLEHLPRPQLVEVVEGVATALRPGGRFIVHTVNGESPFAGRLLYGDLTHELAFTRRSIAQLFRLGRFDRIAVHGVEPVAHGLTSGVRLLLWRAIRSLLLIYLGAETGSLRGHIVSQSLVAVGVRGPA